MYWTTAEENDGKLLVGGNQNWTYITMSGSTTTNKIYMYGSSGSVTCSYHAMNEAETKEALEAAIAMLRLDPSRKRKRHIDTLQKMLNGLGA